MQHLCCVCVVALLLAAMDKVLQMRHLEFPEMKAEVVVVALLMFPIEAGKPVWNKVILTEA